MASFSAQGNVEDGEELENIDENDLTLDQVKERDRRREKRQVKKLETQIEEMEKREKQREEELLKLDKARMEEKRKNKKLEEDFGKYKSDIEKRDRDRLSVDSDSSVNSEKVASGVQNIPDGAVNHAEEVATRMTGAGYSSPRKEVLTGDNMGYVGVPSVVVKVPVTLQGDRVNMPQQMRGGVVEHKAKAPIKLGTFNGSTPLETHLMKLRNCARYGGWDEVDRACSLRHSLEGDAAQVLTNVSDIATEEEIINKLRNRFGNLDQQERFRAELKGRRRRYGESIQAVYQDVSRLLELAFPGRSGDGELYDLLARDSLLDALDDNVLRVKILEHGPKTIEDVLRQVCRYEAFASKGEESGNAKKSVRVLTPNVPSSKEGSSGVEEVEKRMRNLEDELNDFRREWRQSLSQPVTVQPRREPSTQNFVHQPSQGWNNSMRNVSDNRPSEAQQGSSQQRPYYPRQPRGSGRFNTRGSRFDNNRGGRWFNHDEKPFNAGGDHPRQSQSNTTPGGEGASTAVQGGPQKTSNACRIRGVSVSSLSNLDNDVATYVQVDIADQCILFLCDSGAENNIICKHMVPRAILTESDIDLYTASGQRIEVLGQLCLRFTIAGVPFESVFLVTDQLCEPILGFQFLRESGCTWRFDIGKLIVGGMEVGMMCKPARANVRCVYARERVCIAPDMRVNVPVKMRFRHLRIKPGDWVFENKELRPGVLISRALLPFDDKFAAVHVMNISGKEQVLEAGLCIGEAECIAGDESPKASLKDKILEGVKEESVVESTVTNLPCDKLSGGLVSHLYAKRRSAVCMLSGVSAMTSSESSEKTLGTQIRSPVKAESSGESSEKTLGMQMSATVVADLSGALAEKVCCEQVIKTKTEASKPGELVENALGMQISDATLENTHGRPSELPVNFHSRADEDKLSFVDVDARFRESDGILEKVDVLESSLDSKSSDRSDSEFNRSEDGDVSELSDELRGESLRSMARGQYEYSDIDLEVIVMNLCKVYRAVIMESVIISRCYDQCGDGECVCVGETLVCPESRISVDMFSG